MTKSAKDKVIGKRIRMIREKKGLNQAQLAGLATITPAAICQIEAGDRIPSTPILRRVASVLGVTMDFILGEADESKFEDLLRDDDIQKFFRDYQNLNSADQQTIQQQIEFLKHKSELKK